MAIIITFPNPADSPTGAEALRLRYSIDGDDVRLHYSHGKRQLTCDDWARYTEWGAVITVGNP